MDNLNYEKIVKRKIAGKLLLAKIGLIALYVIFPVIGALLALLLANGSPALILTICAIDCIIVFFTWPLTNVEYEYSIISGLFYVSKIYGKSRRKEIFEEELSRAVIVAPYNEKYSDKVERSNPDKIIEAISHAGAKDIWFALFENDEKQKVLVLFEADTRALRALRKFCPRAIVREGLIIDPEKKDESEDL